MVVSNHHSPQSFIQNLEQLPISKDSICPNLYLLPLITHFIADLYRKKSMEKGWVKAVFPSLKAQHLQLLEYRSDPKNGLPYLLDPSESMLPQASYWDMANKAPLLEPTFLALFAASLEALIFLGGKIRQKPNDLIEANELLVYCINERLWDEEYGVYFPTSLNNDTSIL